MPAWLWLDAAAVARQGYDAVMAGVPIYVNGRIYRAIVALVRVRAAWLIRSIEQRLGHRSRE